MSKKNRERRRVRQEQKRHGPMPGSAPGDRAEHLAFLRNFAQQASVPEPASWPGACDPSLARPDLVKAALGDFATNGTPGRAKYRQFERDLTDGILESAPELKHWAMEEFLWHGRPGDPWHPIDAFLEREGDRFPARAADQLRLWKQARIGFFEVGPASSDRVTLREFDPVTQASFGPDFQAISLGIGGVNFYGQHMDSISLGYLAPWAPDADLYCAMGYGLMLPPEVTPGYAPLLGLRHPDVVARPYPWKTSPAERQRHVNLWRQRAWPDWLAERLTFPFEAVGKFEESLQVVDIQRMLPATPDEFRDFGLYFEADYGNEAFLLGATAVLPIEMTTPNALLLAEYRAYRDLVGPPLAVSAEHVEIDPPGHWLDDPR